MTSTRYEVPTEFLCVKTVDITLIIYIMSITQKSFLFWGFSSKLVKIYLRNRELYFFRANNL
jgi:hypothetical protein